jgi:hypothetical protein
LELDEAEDDEASAVWYGSTSSVGRAAEEAVRLVMVPALPGPMQALFEARVSRQSALREVRLKLAAMVEWLRSQSCGECSRKGGQPIPSCAVV